MTTRAPVSLASHDRPQHGRFRLGRLCVSATLVSCLGLVIPVAASAAPQRDIGAVTVPAGSLGAALNRFASQTGLTLSYTPDTVDGRQTRGVSHASSIEQALDDLLDGTGLTAHRSGSGYVIVKAPVTTSTDLDPITVSAAQLISGVAPVEGYVASASRAATKTDTPLIETPRSVSVITARQIADRNALSVEDAVAYTAGVSVGGSGLDPRYDQISIRGYAATANADFLDGLRQPNTGWLSYYTSVPYALERIEILKGPASVLYGQISPGGIANRVSKRPSENAINEVAVQAGSHDHRQAQFDLGGALDDAGDVRYRVVGLAREAETDIEQVDNDATLLAPSLRLRLDDDTQLTLLAQYQERQTAGGPKTYQEGDTLTDFWSGDAGFDKLDQHQWSLGYEFEHHFNDTFSLQHNLRYGHVDTTNQYLSVTGANGNVLDRTSFGVYETMQSVASDTRLVSRFQTGAAEHTLLTGIDYAYLDYDVEYASGSAPPIDRDDPDYHQHVPHPDNVAADLSGLSHRQGAYLMDQISLGRWRLSAGVRQDWIDARTDNHLTSTRDRSHESEPSVQVGALYLFDSGFAPYLSYATSFLPQSGTNVYGDAYRPTEGEQYEAGLKYQPPGSDTLMTASLYQLTQTNVLTSDPENPLNQLQTGEQRSRGLELELVSDLTEALSMTASYSYNHAEITRDNDGHVGNTPVNVPEHLASLWVDYDVTGGPLRGAGVSLGTRYIGTSYVDADNSGKNESYTLVDAGAHYDFSGALNGVRAGINAQNLTDKRYLVCDSGYCYRGAGRSVIGSLSYRW